MRCGVIRQRRARKWSKKTMERAGLVTIARTLSLRRRPAADVAIAGEEESARVGGNWVAAQLLLGMILIGPRIGLVATSLSLPLRLDAASVTNGGVESVGLPSLPLKEKPETQGC